MNLAYMLAVDHATSDDARRRIEAEFDPKRRAAHRGNVAGMEHAPWWFNDGDDVIDVKDLAKWGVSPAALKAQMFGSQSDDVVKLDG